MALLFDLDGVFYRGEEPIPGAAAVAAWAREEGIAHLFLTNTTSRPREALVDKLQAFGIETDPRHILTPPIAAVDWCSRHLPGRPVALLVPEQTKPAFSSLPVARLDDEVDALIVGDLGREWTFDLLNRAFRALMRPARPRLIALGMTRFWRASDGLQLDVAPFVVALSHAAEVEPLVMGKPAASFYRIAADLLGEAPGNLIMVGDDIRADVDGAQKAGMRGVLVRTGKFREADLAVGIRPAAVLDSVADLPAWYDAAMMHR